MFISMYSILNSYITSNKVGICQLHQSKLFGVIGMFLSLLAGRLSGRLGTKRVLTFSALYLRGITYTHGNPFTNIVLIYYFSVTFVAGIAFAIPTVISKVGLW